MSQFIINFKIHSRLGENLALKDLKTERIDEDQKKKITKPKPNKNQNITKV
jgi:hypothetical protein